MSEFSIRIRYADLRVDVHCEDGDFTRTIGEIGNELLRMNAALLMQTEDAE